MKEKDQDQYLAALDLGSSKVRVVISELLGTGEGPSFLRFIGYGESESLGWKRGNIVDLDAVTHSIQEAMEQAENMAGVSVESVVVGVGGPHVQGATANCGITLGPGSRELTRDDVRRVMDTARQVPLSKDREILHLLPEEFSLDSQRGILDPIGMDGSYLGARAQVITGSVAASANLVAAVNRAGILVDTVAYEALATAEGAISEEEREAGVLLAVLGAGSCDMVAFRHGTLRLAGVIPLGGDHFTNDVAVGLHAAARDAEVLKTTMGSVLPGEAKEGITIEVPREGDRPPRYLPLRSLSGILESRAEELMNLILDELRRVGLDHYLGAGVVLSGGCAKLRGLCDLAEKILGAPARLGLPSKIVDMPESLESPEHSTLLGLLLYAQRLARLRVLAEQRNLGSRWKSLIAGRR